MPAKNNTQPQGRRPDKAEQEIPAAANAAVVAQKDDMELPEKVHECIHTLITTRAKAYPQRLAVDAWDGRLTYGELDRLSTRLARRLLAFEGVGPEAIVPLCFDKSMWTTVAVLGVLKAGAAIALLNMTQPASRLQSMVRQCNPAVLCTSSAHEAFCSGLSANVVVVGPDMLQGEGEEQGQELGDEPLTLVGPDNPMYVCFTSGSTGEPKGIVITHAAMASAMHHQLPVLPLDGTSRLFDFAAYNFDVATHNVVATLLVGGCLCVPSDEQRMSRLNDTMRDMAVTVVNLTASVARLLLRAEAVPTLETVLLLGEAVSAKDIEHLWGRVRVINTYGPAECTPISTINLNAADPVTTATCMGKGVGVRTWVVDADNHDKLLEDEPGVIGELLLEGPTLARGYLGQPDKTRAAFIRSPPWLMPGGPHIGPHTGERHTESLDVGRLYKTGDLVQRLADGSLRFVSRKDTQIKISGQRVELADIEHNVRECIQSATAAVVDMIHPGNESANACLAVFLTLDDGNEVYSDVIQVLPALECVKLDDAIHVALRKRLPSYMVPAVFFRLDSLPMTASGKTDRLRLREMGSALSIEQLAGLGRDEKEGVPHQPPQTEMESRLRDLWAEVLGQESQGMGRRDSFFRLGGNSLAAMRLSSALRRLGMALDVSDVFQNPVLHDQAERIREVEAVIEADITPFGMLRVDRRRRNLPAELAVLCPGVGPGMIEDAYPCTPLQEGLLTLTAGRPGAYEMRAVLRLGPDVRLDRFRAAWEAVVRSTTILRTRFVPTKDWGFVQVVCTVDKVDWDLDESPLHADLGHAPWRASITSDSFVLRMHHALYDGWSLSLLTTRLRDAYEHGLRAERTSFGAFVSTTLVQGLRLEKAQVYWRSYFSDDASFVPFPSVPATPAGSTAQEPKAMGRLEAKLPVKMTSIRGDVTASTVIRAALAVFMAQQTDSEDVVFGTVLSGRNASVDGIDELVGPAIATVPIRLRVQQDQPVTDLLQSVQRDAAEMMAYEQTGLQNIARLSDGCRLACGFQTLLVVQPQEDGMDGESELGQWVTTSTESASGPYALTLEFAYTEGGADGDLVLKVAYDEAVLDSKTVRAMADQLGFITEQLITARPGETISRLELVPQHHLETIWRWNASVPDTIPGCIHDVITRQALKRPGATALDGWDGRLTYAQLDGLSSRLAGRLSRPNPESGLGIGRGDVVPLCFAKSIWTVVAILAVLKTGAAFVLLEPSLPEARLKFIVDKVQARLILSSISNTHLSSRLASTVLVLDPAELRENDAKLAGEMPGIQHSDGSSLAYIIFTSGSTGHPKGCLITHASIVSAMHHQARAMGHGPGIRAVDLTSYAFDMSLALNLYALSAGGCVCVPSSEDRLDDVAGCITSFDAEFVALTPTVARLLTPDQVPSLRTLHVGGEALTEADVRPWWRTEAGTRAGSETETESESGTRTGPGPGLRVINGYGPSECTPMAIGMCDARTPLEATCIGRGLGCVTWLADPRTGCQRLVPIGSVGEILLEGPIVGQGYLDEPDRTKAAFLVDPAWLGRGVPGRNTHGRRGRLYRTGDLARYTEDGRLVFVGRRDGQVKIRGQRVELEEVEQQTRQALAPLHDVKSVVVEVIQPRQGDDTATLLAAFIQMTDKDISSSSSSPGRLMTEGELATVKDGLARCLPRYMVPSLFVLVESMPVSNSGKADRRRLREMGMVFAAEAISKSRTAAEDEKQCRFLPVSPEEAALRPCWASALRIGVGDVPMDHSFFQHGGDSVAAMRLVAAARERGLRLTVRDIFDNPTLAGQASLTTLTAGAGRDGIAPEQVDPPPGPLSMLLEDQKQGDEVGVRAELAALCGAAPEDIQDAYPCTSLQEGLLSLTARYPERYVEQMTLELATDTSLDRLKRAWQAVVGSEAAAILRTIIVHHERLGLVQTVLRDGGIRWGRGRDLESYLREDKAETMGLGVPLCRFAVVDSSPPSLVLTMHHAVYDGWSLSLLTRLVSEAYRSDSLPDGIQAQQRPSFASFVQHVTRVRQDAESEMYWRSCLAGCPADSFPALPPAVQNPEPDTWVERDLSLVRASGSRIMSSTVLRAALALLIAHYTASADVVFGAVVSGRAASVVGVDAVLGPTIGTVPVRVRLPPGQTVDDYLDTVQKMGLDMTPHEQTGLQRIVGFGPDGANACAFQTLLVTQASDEANTLDDGGGRIGTWSTQSRPGDFSTSALMLECTLKGVGARVRATFDKRVLDEWLVDRMLSHLAFIAWRLAESPVKRGTTTVATTTTMTTVEDVMKDVASLDEALVWQWNRDVPLSENTCLHHLLDRRALSQPDRPAVDAWDGRWTYEELMELAETVAGQLREADRDMGPGTIVPLCFDKSGWMIVAMLAVLKAGAAFLPIDPAGAVERTERIMVQCGATVVLTSASHQTAMSKRGRRVLVIDADTTAGGGLETASSSSSSLPSLAASSSTLAAAEATPDSIAYVLFTSGSSGVPKGVTVHHAAASSSCLHHGRALDLGPDTRTLQFSSYTFDACIFEIVTTLLFGGCVCVPTDRDRLSGLGDVINDGDVNTLLLTPTVCRLLDPGCHPSVHTLLIGGERSNEDDFRRWAGNVTRLVNGYGPTECTVLSSLCFHDGTRMTTSGSSSPSSPPSMGSDIGTGVGSVLWVAHRDDHDRLAAVGAVGELIVEGPGVARGYIGDPIRTEAVFIKDPAWLIQGRGSDCPGRRGTLLYKTGDLVRYGPGGRLHYVGRKDMQTKIRGQRLELSEVEHHVHECLRARFPVGHVIAEVLRHRQAEMLVVFLSVAASSGGGDEEEAGLDKPGAAALDAPWHSGRATHGDHVKVLQVPAEVEAALSRRLPSYMLPSVYLRIPQMPLMPSGKADRRKLRSFEPVLSARPLLELQGHSSAESGGGTAGPADEDVESGTGRMPHSDAEKLLARMWAQALGVPQDDIRAGDGFFALGGDSVAAMKLASLTRRMGKGGLGVPDIFRYPTLSAQARVISSPENRETAATTARMRPFDLLNILDDRAAEELRLRLSALCGVDPTQVEDAYPCTPLQAALMASTQQDPDSYVMQATLELGPHVKLDAFRAAWEDVVDSLPILRSRIVQHAHHGLLQVPCRLPIDWRCHDSLERFQRDRKGGRIGLGTPLSEFSMVAAAAGGEARRFVWTLHHAIYDGWSLQHVIGLVGDAYRRRARGAFSGVTEQLRDLSRQPSFATFVKHVMGQDKDEARDYWVANCSSLDASAIFPTPPMPDAPKRTVATASTVERELERRSRPGITEATMIKAGLGLVISRICDTAEAIFGTVTMGRSDTAAYDIQDVVGPTIATVPVRVRVGTDQTVSDFLETIQRQAAQMIPFEHTGLQAIAKMGALCQLACRFQTLLVLQVRAQGVEGDDGTLGTWSLSDGSLGTYAVVLECTLSDELRGPHIRAVFDSSVVDTWVIEGLLDRLDAVLASFAQAPVGQRVSDLKDAADNDLRQFQRRMEYWQRQLDDGQPAQFLYDMQRPAKLSGKADSVPFTANRSLCELVQRRCRERNLTPMTIFLAAFRAMHYRVTGSKDAIMGAVAGSHDGGGRLLCARLATESEQDDTFEDILNRVDRTLKDALTNDMPPETVASKLQRDVDPLSGPQPLIRVAVHLYPGQGQEAAEPVATSSYEVELRLLQEESSMVGQLVFSTDLYHKKTMESHLGVMLTILEEGLTWPAQSVASMPLMTADALARIDSLGLLHVNTTDYQRDASIPDVFARQVRANPDRTAVKDAGSQLTFTQLDEQSDRVAAWLTNQGFWPETVIGVYATRSCEATVALLGVLKANLAYLPMDVTTPAARIDAMLSTVESLTHILVGSGMDVPDTTHQATFIPISDILSSARKPSRGPPSPPTATSLAYVMFTSGSTGRPKGVMIEHRGVVRSVTDTNLTHSSPAGLAVAHLATLAFDLATAEIYLALLNGRTLVCISASDARDPRAMAAIFRRERIGTACLTPALFHQCLLLAGPSMFDSVEAVYLAGDRLDPRQLAPIRKTVRATLINGYGPTENTCGSTFYQLDRRVEDEVFPNGVPIGGPVSNSGAHIMDAQQRLVPLGVVGEIVVTGDGLARGYTDPRKNVDRFVTISVDGEQIRAYRTGDYGRYRPADGQMELFGRMDGQVKIRGNRVEVAEVEGALLCCEELDKAVVVVVPAHRQRQDASLVAFVTVSMAFSGDTERLVERLDEMLRVQLPSYMVPRHTVVLETLPLNENGKLDRRRLIDMASESTATTPTIDEEGLTSGKRQPRTDMEHQLREIWASVLNIEATKIGVDDSFFRLGGDSITAMQVSALARAGIADISTADVLEKKTIARLVAGAGDSADHGTEKHTEDEYDGEDGQDEDRAVAQDGEAFDLSPLQQLYMDLEPDPARVILDRPMLFQVRHPYPFASICRAMEVIVARHAVLRSRFLQTDGRWQQRVSSDVASSAHMRHVETSHPGEEELAETISQCRRAINIEKGPLVAGVVIGQARGPTQRLFLSVSPLVADPVSWRVILQDLQDALEGQKHSEEALKPLPAMSFRSGGGVQAEYGGHGREDNCGSRSGSDPGLHNGDSHQSFLLFWDVQSGENTQGAAKTSGFRLEKATSSALLGRCNDVMGTRPAEIMIAALLHAFHAIFGGHRTMPEIFWEGRGRGQWEESPDCGRTVGCFTAMWPISPPPDADKTSLLDLVRAVKDTVRAPSDHDRSYLASSGDGSSSGSELLPVEVAFHYAGAFPQPSEGDASLFHPLPLPPGCDPASAASARRLTLFDVLAHVEEDGCLALDVVYPSAARHQEDIVAWIEQYRRTLDEAARLLGSDSQQLRASRLFTLSDLPLAGFKSYAHLEEFQTRVLPALHLSPAHVEDVFPLSASQEGMMVAQLRDPSTYRSTHIMEILCPRRTVVVDPDEVARAWRAVVRRHALLRAVLLDRVPGADRTMHIVLRDPRPAITRGRYGGRRDDGTVPDDDHQPLPTVYDEGGLQHHASIVPVDPYRVSLRLDINHVICDGPSAGVLLRDVLHAYQGRLPSPVVSPAPSYARFVRYAEQQPRQTSLAYWAAHLDGVSPCHLVPPSAGGKTATVSDREDLFPVKMVQGRIDEIRAFCTEWEVTTASIVLVAWALVLRAHTGAPTPCFGTVTSGRDLPIEGISDIFGPLINTVPTRVRLEDVVSGSSVLQTLRDMRAGYLASLPHQTFPLIEIQRALHTGASGLFNTIVSFQRGDGDGDVVDGEDGVCIRVVPGRDQVDYDIVLQVADGGLDGLGIRLKCRGGFFSTAADGHRVAEMLGNAISAMVRNPHARPTHLALLTDSDLERIWSWNGPLPEAGQHLIHDLVLEQARCRPRASAVHAWDGHLTYGELDELSGLLAARLSALGIGTRSGMLVPVCFEKSMWTSVAVLGVLRAGAAFVLFDSTLPEQRLQTMADQIGPDVFLSSVSNYQLSLRLCGTATVLRIGPEMRQDGRVIGRHHRQPQHAGPPSDVTMYAVFTSGSTGTPKATLLTHGNFGTLLRHQLGQLGIDQSSRVFDHAAYAFDIAVDNALGAMAAGACLCVPSEADRRERLGETMRAMGVTMAMLTPTVTGLIDPAGVPALETLVFTGEALPASEARRWWDHVRVVNAYGPAECNIVTLHSRAATPEEATGIGTGTGAGAVTWVVEPGHHDVLVPPGSVGELLIEGPLVGQGYLGDTDKTDEVFIRDPTWLRRGTETHPGRSGRLYKTGDLVRYNVADGSLVYVGRNDSQVKIRGQRVELGEVERTLRECMPDISQAVAEIIVPDGHHPMLVAFVQHKNRKKRENKSGAGEEEEEEEEEDTIAEKGQVPGILPMDQETHAKMAQSLPRYMVPSLLLSLPTLPVSATGKTDRKRLREMGRLLSPTDLTAAMSRSARGRRRMMAAQRPGTAQERRMARIWAESIGLDEDAIGTDDNFFRLGGDSMTAMKAVYGARRAGMALHMADIFRHDTLASLCGHVAAATQAEEDGGPSQDGDGGGRDQGATALRLVGEAQREALLKEMEETTDIPRHDVVDILPLTDWQRLSVDQGKTYGRFCDYLYLHLGLVDLDIDRLRTACDLVLDTFPLLRACWLPLQSAYWQVVLDRRRRQSPLRVVDLDDGSRSLDEASDDFCRRDAREVGLHDPTMAFILLSHPQKGYRLVLRASHAQYDGSCLPVLVQSLLDAYHDRPLHPRPVFSSYLAHTHELRLKSIAYWTHLLRSSSLSPVLDMLRPAATSSSPLPQLPLTIIRAEGHARVARLPPNTTVSNLVGASWAVMLSRLTGRDEVIYSQLVAGRNAASLEGIDRVLGPCINLVPVRVAVSVQDTTSDLIRSVQTQHLALGDADALGLDDIQRHCAPSWPEGGRPDTVVQLQNVDENPSFDFLGRRCTLGFWQNPDIVPRGLGVICHPVADGLRVNVVANSHIMTAQTAQALLDGFTTILERLSSPSSPTATLGSCLNDVSIQV